MDAAQAALTNYRVIADRAGMDKELQTSKDGLEVDKLAYHSINQSIIARVEGRQ